MPRSIASGLLHTVASISDLIRDWWQLSPNSQIIFVGGDGEFLVGYLQAILSVDVDKLKFVSIASLKEHRDLLFHGLFAVFC